MSAVPTPLSSEPDMATLLAQPIEAQAAYADAACRRFATNVPFLEDMLQQPARAFTYTPSAALPPHTALGNFAYLALHAPPDTHRARFRALYNGYVAGASARIALARTCEDF